MLEVNGMDLCCLTSNTDGNDNEGDDEGVCLDTFRDGSTVL